MKCEKLTYKSPLYGSVFCEDLIDAPDNCLNFGPQGVLALYNRGDNLMRLLSERQEDLKEYLPLDLEDLIVKAVFGIDYVEDGKMYLLTEIYVRQEPDELQYREILEWITGQLSDGWGEGLEQQQVLEEKIYFNKPIFNGDTCVFEEEEIRSTVYFYVHPWSSNGNWVLELVSNETVELDIEEPDKKEEVLKDINDALVQILRKLEELT